MDISYAQERVIFDTDIGPDWDDVGATATLHALAAWVKISEPIPDGWRTIIEHNRWGNNWFGLWKSANGNLDKIVQNADVPEPEIAELRIGINLDGNEGFNGIIDDVRVYNRVLDGAEVKNLLTVTAIENDNKFINKFQPNKYTLSNYPNPFNPTTTIHYSIPIQSHVSIDVYDIKGKKINTLVNEKKQAGNHTYQFDGRSHSSGVYFYRIVTDKITIAKKMLLLK